MLSSVNAKSNYQGRDSNSLIWQELARLNRCIIEKDGVVTYADGTGGECTVKVLSVKDAPAKAEQAEQPAGDKFTFNLGSTKAAPTGEVQPADDKIAFGFGTTWGQLGED